MEMSECDTSRLQYGGRIDSEVKLCKTFSPFQNDSAGVRRAEKLIHKSVCIHKNRCVCKTGEETGLQFHVCVCVCMSLRVVCFNRVSFYLQQGLLVL